jgi:hypothetical protein
MVAKSGIDDWKNIADHFGLKSKKDAIIEFMKIDVANVDMSDLYPKGVAPITSELTGIEPYNQSDMYLRYCDMLI